MSERHSTTLAHIEIGEPIAETALFRVVEAFQPGGSRPAMLKVTQEGVLDAAGVARCLARAGQARGIKHPNLAQLFAVEGEGDALAFVAELVDGPSLEQILNEAERGRPPVEARARWVAQLARAVDIIHARDLTHGAIRPGTVLIERQTNTARLVDLGTACVEREAEGLPAATPEDDLEALTGLFVLLMEGGASPATDRPALPEPLHGMTAELRDTKHRPRSGNAFAAAIEAGLSALQPQARLTETHPAPRPAPRPPGLAETPAPFESGETVSPPPATPAQPELPTSAGPARALPAPPKTAPAPSPFPQAPASAPAPAEKTAPQAAPVRAEGKALPALALPRSWRKGALLAGLVLLLALLVLWLWPGAEETPPVVEAPPIQESPPLATNVPSKATPEVASTPEAPSAPAMSEATATVPETPVPAALDWAGLVAWTNDRPCTRVERGDAPGPDLRAWTGNAGDASKIAAEAKRLPGASEVAVVPVGDGTAPLCRVFDLLRQAGHPEDPLVRLLPPRVEPRLLGGDPLVLRLPPQAGEAYVRVDYFAADGNVVHLLPKDGDAALVPAGEERLLGDPAKGLWLRITPPFGQEMVLALRSPQDLGLEGRAYAEPAGAYLDALSAALAKGGAAASVIVIETALRPADG